MPTVHMSKKFTHVNVLHDDYTRAVSLQFALLLLQVLHDLGSTWEKQCIQSKLQIMQTVNKLVYRTTVRLTIDG